MNNGVKIGHIFPVKSTPLQSTQAAASRSVQPTEFQNLLDSKVLKFSHHAEVRMQQRGIKLQPESLTKIINAVEDAASKGAQDSLIVFRDIAMIVNVPSRTVVTAMDGGQMRSNVFTQIDSAIILN
ncbi:flagellar biosynthesis protein [Paenibacillus sp. FSL H8-0548]|uniref:TIGR02530 family flagellar biosynthesis protein n=1 Tax=Paenibacillus sp. FSL H8-0548 TaxID=1920422 RepID=UPI00096D0086|nr:TIGR02530 family flagellar biosynthesis protein [Paenibacillus sp. FSL H8-0548]OMF36803.1 flagellar biosynthesis protein [Paenibacillus sp. FSL H8-0548]